MCGILGGRSVALGCLACTVQPGQFVRGGSVAPDVLFGLIMGVLGLIVVAPAVARASALSLRLMLALCGIALCFGLAALGPVKSDAASGSSSCGTVFRPDDQTAANIHSGCDRAMSDAHWSLVLLFAPSLYVAVRCVARLRRDLPPLDG